MSLVTTVPATLLKVLSGKQLLQWSARWAICLRTAGFSLSMVPFTGDKGDDAARSYLIQRAGCAPSWNGIDNVSLIHHLELAERDIADGGVEKTIRQVKFFQNPYLAALSTAI